MTLSDRAAAWCQGWVLICAVVITICSTAREHEWVRWVQAFAVVSLVVSATVLLIYAYENYKMLARRRSR